MNSIAFATLSPSALVRLGEPQSVRGKVIRWVVQNGDFIQRVDVSDSVNPSTEGEMFPPDLVSICRHMLEAFQGGAFASDDNADALDALDSFDTRWRQQPEFWRSHVEALDGPGPGGAPHIYRVGGPLGQTVQFQCGGRSEPGSVAGVFLDDLLAIVQHHISLCEHATGDRFSVLDRRGLRRSIYRARSAIARRLANRVERGVLGTMKS